MKHAYFKDIPLDGCFDDFSRQLIQLGYTYDEDSNVFSGKFANEFVQIGVECTPKSNIIYGCYVRFGLENLWDNLKDKYFKYKNLYRKKYGKPKEEGEFFVDPYCEGDGDELIATCNSHCIYCSSFTIPGGKATIYLNEQRLFICIFDDINTKVLKKEEEEIAYDDI